MANLTASVTQSISLLQASAQDLQNAAVQTDQNSADHSKALADIKNQLTKMEDAAKNKSSDEQLKKFCAGAQELATNMDNLTSSIKNGDKVKIILSTSQLAGSTCALSPTWGPTGQCICSVVGLGISLFDHKGDTASGPNIVKILGELMDRAVDKIVSEISELMKAEKVSQITAQFSKTSKQARTLVRNINHYQLNPKADAGDQLMSLWHLVLGDVAGGVAKVEALFANNFTYFWTGENRGHARMNTGRMIEVLKAYSDFMLSFTAIANQLAMALTAMNDNRDALVRKCADDYSTDFQKVLSTVGVGLRPWIEDRLAWIQKDTDKNKTHWQDRGFKGEHCKIMKFQYDKLRADIVCTVGKMMEDTVGLCRAGDTAYLLHSQFVGTPPAWQPKGLGTWTEDICEMALRYNRFKKKPKSISGEVDKKSALKVVSDLHKSGVV